LGELLVRHAISNRVGYLVVAGVLVAVLLVGLGDRLLTRWAYALEQGRIQANSDELAGLQEVSRAFRMVAKIVRPGVVHIRVSGLADTQARKDLEERLRAHFREHLSDLEIEELLRKYFEAPVSSGSGIILDREGHILTNNHVVGGRAEVFVRLHDEGEYDATLVGTDPKTDLAVIKVTAPDLHPLEFGDSDKMEVGDWVLAVGAPFGLTQSVTHGIISAKGRGEMLNIPIRYQDFLQTDAAINPGNSGGPLVNLRGEVIGVNTAISTDGGGYNMGVAFTIPSNMARSIARELITRGEVARGWLGISMAELTDEDVELFGLPGKRGVMVDVIYQESPARQADLRCEDIIVTVNGRSVNSMRELRTEVGELRPGEPAALKLIRDGQELAIDVRLGKQPEDISVFVSRAQPVVARDVQPLALQVRTMRDGLVKTLEDNLGSDQDLPAWAGQHTDKRGVFVLDRVRLGEAEQPTDESPLGVAPGELIVSCNDRPVVSVTELTQALEAGRDSPHAELVVLEPDGERRTVRVKRR
jgi:serine protease Do